MITRLDGTLRKIASVDISLSSKLQVQSDRLGVAGTNLGGKHGKQMGPGERLEARSAKARGSLPQEGHPDASTRSCGARAPQGKTGRAETREKSEGTNALQSTSVSVLYPISLCTFSVLAPKARSASGDHCGGVYIAVLE